MCRETGGEAPLIETSNCTVSFLPAYAGGVAISQWHLESTGVPGLRFWLPVHAGSTTIVPADVE